MSQINTSYFTQQTKRTYIQNWVEYKIITETQPQIDDLPLIKHIERCSPRSLYPAFDLLNRCYSERRQYA